MDDPNRRRTVAEVLESDAEMFTTEARNTREQADELTVKAHRLRAKADRLELQAVESRAAANILREVGLRADRTDDGIPRIQVDRVLASEPPETEDR